MENWGRGKPSDDAEHTPEGGVFGKMLFGHFMLVFSALTMDQRDSLLLGISMNPSTKSAGKPHEMSIVKMLIRPHQLTPPSPKATRRLSQIKIGIQHNTIYTIICAIQEVLILLTEFISCIQSGSPRSSVCSII